MQDTITLGMLSISAGLRLDQYRGLSRCTGVEPRIGASYQVAPTGTVLRLAYSRTFESPYNDNLVLSSSTGSGGLAENVFGAFGSRPIEPGRRNHYNVGVEQTVRKYLLIDADYFWKYTRNAFDFGTLLNTPIQFPISWAKSKIDGVSVRLSTPNMKGLQIYTTMGHTRSRCFGTRMAASYSTRRSTPAYSESITTRHFSRRRMRGISARTTGRGRRSRAAQQPAIGFFLR